MCAVHSVLAVKIWPPLKYEVYGACRLEIATMTLKLICILQTHGFFWKLVCECV